MISKKVSTRKLVYLALVFALLASLFVVDVGIADTETMNSYIGGTAVTLYAQGDTFDNRDGYNAGASWISRSYPERVTTKGFNPASVYSRCNIGGFEIDRSTITYLPSTGWASVTKYVTYRDSSCYSWVWPQRQVIAECKHALYHDYGVWEPWTTSSIVINCSNCNP